MFRRARTEETTGDAPVGLDKSIDRLEERRDSKEGLRVAGELKGQRARGFLEKLLTRALSGIIYVLLIVGCIFWGTYPTAALMALMGWACASEFYRICRMGGRRPNEILGLAAAIAFPVVAVIFNIRQLLIVTSALLMMAGVWYVFNPRANISDVAVTCFAPLYTSLSLALLTVVRASHPGIEGFWLTLVCIGSIWAEDSFAYLVGSTLGAHKMAPRISPNKSWEGFVGGLVGAILVWCVAAGFGLCGITWQLAIPCGVVEGLVAVLGDLFESRIKRGVGVKDSGNLLPGHGGLLDRTDSLLFGSVAAFYLLALGGIL